VYATVHTHISLLTSKGLAQQEEGQGRMEEKEVNNGWSQYGPRTVTDGCRIFTKNPTLPS
jgi:hypothetical protein